MYNFSKGLFVVVCVYSMLVGQARCKVCFLKNEFALLGGWKEAPRGKEVAERPGQGGAGAAQLEGQRRRQRALAAPGSQAQSAGRPPWRSAMSSSLVALLAVFAVFASLLGERAVLGNPDAKRLYDDLLSNYNRLIRPVSNNTDTVLVKLGLRLSQLIELVSLPNNPGPPTHPYPSVVRDRGLPRRGYFSFDLSTGDQSRAPEKPSPFGPDAFAWPSFSMNIMHFQIVCTNSLLLLFGRELVVGPDQVDGCLSGPFLRQVVFAELRKVGNEKRK